MLPEDQLDAYEEQFADVDEKTILIWQLAELTAIRQALTEGQPDDTEDLYECDHCGTVVEASDREQHAGSHDLPPSMEPAAIFGPVGK